jgi:serine protease AprX
MNLSVGRPVWESYSTDPLGRAVETAWRNGIVVVVSAGNWGRLNEKMGGYGTITSPGNHPAVITVGALRHRDTSARMDERLASFSSRGPSIVDGVMKPDVVAVGNKVASLLSPNSTLALSPSAMRVPRGYYCTASTCGTTPSTDYLYLSGTSMAAPMVAGTAALMILNDAALRPAWTAAGQTFVPDTRFLLRLRLRIQPG